MHKISALFKTPRDDKQKESVDEGDNLAPHVYESLSDSSGSYQTRPRLLRSPVIRGLRHSENAHLSGNFLNATDHSTTSNSGLPSDVFSTPNMSSTYPTSFKMGSPLPSPPRSPAQATIQAPSLWPLPSPRQPPKKTDDSGNLESLENGHGVPTYLLDGDVQKSLQSTMPKENNQRFSSPLAMATSISPRDGGRQGNCGAGHISHAGGLPSRNAKSGGGGDAHLHAKQVEPSIVNGHFSSALQNPHETGNQKDTWRWKHELTTTDGFSSVEDSYMGHVSYQNGTSSRDAGHSKHHPKRTGTPASSPPLSPSTARALTPGGWQKGRLLGSGAFGKVYKGIHSETGEFCAIKEVEFVGNDHRCIESAKQLEKEIAALSTLQHPNIVQYKGSEMVGESLYIYLELISGGSLYKLYQEFNKFEEPVVRRYTRQILLGLQYLHSRKFVHRDIKCANILVDQDGNIKLADFGVAKYIKEQGVPFSLKGSPNWMAPEVILSMNTGFEYAMDIWSLGCTVIEMVTGKPPWCDFEAAAVMFKVTKVGAPPIPESLSPHGQSFLRLCLQKDPAWRPTAGQLLEHPFVQIHNDAYHPTIHAFDALNTLDLGELRLPVSASFIHPSSSAPSSPRSSHRLVRESNAPQSNPISSPRHRGGGLHSVNVEQNWHPGNSSIVPQKGLGKPKNRVPASSERRQSHEFTRTRARPSSSAPVSPKSSQSTYGNLYPTRSAEMLSGYPTPFSESRGNPRHSPDLGQDFRHTGG